MNTGHETTSVRPDSRGAPIAAAIAGLVLGLIPHALGLMLGMANFLISPLLLPILAVGLGWWLGRQWPHRRWMSVLIASVLAGAAYVGGLLIQLMVLAQLNGRWEQTLAVPSAFKLALGAAIAAALFISIGGLLSMIKRAT